MRGRLSYVGHGGLVLAADVAGDPDATPVLLLHGAGQTRHSWVRAMEALAARGFHVVALDHRGHGDSEWARDGDYSIDAISEDVRSVVRSFKRPPAIVGASLGGATGMLAIADTANGARPVTASALILVDVVARMTPGGADRIRGFMGAAPEGFESLEAASEAIAKYLPHRPRPSSLEGLRKNLRQREDGRWYWHWDPAYMASRSRSGPLTDRMEAAAAQVRCPTLIVRGGRSELVDREGVDHLRGLIPHAEAVDVAGAHHMVAGDRNDAFNGAIDNFLGRHLTPFIQREIAT